jgi:hypothetical protein
MRMVARGMIAGLVLAGVAVPGMAADEFAYDLDKSHQPAMRAFQTIVPARYRKAAWVYRFSGTTSPMQTVEVGGRPFWLGEVCKPHDCGGNEVAFLIAKDGAVAYGLLRSVELTQSQDVAFGDPDPAARKLMDGQLQRE